MQNIFYQPPGVWFGDCMPFGLHDTFYLFHQRDTRNPAPFGEPFGWHLSTTKDFVHYEDHGIALPRGTVEEQDQFILRAACSCKTTAPTVFSTPATTAITPLKASHRKCFYKL